MKDMVIGDLLVLKRLVADAAGRQALIQLEEEIQLHLPQCSIDISMYRHLVKLKDQDRALFACLQVQ